MAQLITVTKITFDGSGFESSFEEYEDIRYPPGHRNRTRKKRLLTPVVINVNNIEKLLPISEIDKSAIYPEANSVLHIKVVQEVRMQTTTSFNLAVEVYILKEDVDEVMKLANG